ncbi:heme biosynthesis HemY N-terminal domain-containing protein [Iodidimonas nitroreducens]|nr:heme biosynthesis HemY N-terminal domain-containing protein [Iodidimonas nitroreducens]
MAVQRLLVFLARDLPFSKEKRARRRAEKGYGLLNQAMVALGSGDGKSARALSDKAVRLLPEQPLTHIMAAEAAKLSDDGDRVRQHYQALLDDDLAAFLGLRGLVLQERADGHSGKARELARRAVALRPKSHWALRTLVDFAVQAADWDEALETLDKASRAGVYDKAQSTQHRAALLYCQAVDANLANDQPHALELAQKAAGLRPGLPPAVALAARLHRQANQKKQAEKHLLAGWAAQPHPLLLKEWQAHFPTETAFARLQRIERLIASQPDHLESRLALATAAMGLSARIVRWRRWSRFWKAAIRALLCCGRAWRSVPKTRIMAICGAKKHSMASIAPAGAVLIAASPGIAGCLYARLVRLSIALAGMWCAVMAWPCHRPRPRPRRSGYGMDHRGPGGPLIVLAISVMTSPMTDPSGWIDLRACGIILWSLCCAARCF